MKFQKEHSIFCTRNCGKKFTNEHVIASAKHLVTCHWALSMKKYNWKELNRIQKGTFGEYFAKMEFTMYGAEVYTSEIDDRGIDFVCRLPNSDFFEVQVKTVSDFNLQFVNEHKFKRKLNFLVALVRLEQFKKPEIYLFRGTDWDSDDGLLKYNAYEDKKLSPAYEIRLSKGRLKVLQNYSLENRFSELNT